MASVTDSRQALRRAASRIDLSWALPVLIVVIIAYLTALPIGKMIWDSVQLAPGVLGLDHYERITTNQVAWGVLGNTLVFSVSSAVLSTIIGAILAWFVVRTNMPGRRLFFVLALVPLIIPGVLTTFSWVLLLSPNVGLLNIWAMNIFGLESPPFNAYSMAGMIWVEGLSLSTLSFLLVAGALRSMDASLEEAAATSGATIFETARRITIPLLLPALVSTTLLAFIRAVDGFEVPAMLGMPCRVYVFATQIYTVLKSFPVDYGVVGAYSTLLFLLAAVGVLVYLRFFGKGGFTTVTGKGYRPRVIDLRGFRLAALAFSTLYVFVLFVLPTLVMVWASLLPFYAAPSREALDLVSLDEYASIFSDSRIIRASRNSLVLAISSATIVVLLTSVIAWITVRTRLKGRQVLDIMAFLPIAIPGLVLGVALIGLYAASPIGIYGTIFILVVAYVIKFMPYGMRASSATIVQIHGEIEEAAAVSGANWFETFTRVLLPLLRPGLFAAWVYIFIVATRELSSSIILATHNSAPLAVMIFDLYSNGLFTTLAALGTVMVAVLGFLVFIFQRLGDRSSA